MFVAWRDLRFAKGRFALMGSVIVLITVLVGLLSGLTGGLGQQNISAITSLPADTIAFQKPADGQSISYSDSTLSEQQWRTWADARDVQSAEPLGIASAKAAVAERSTGVSVFGVQPGSSLAPASDNLGSDTAVLSEAAADELGATTGDQVTLSGETLTVASVVDDAYFSHLPVVWTSLAAWREIAPPSATGDRPFATVVALRTAKGVDLGSTDAAADTHAVSVDDSLSAIGSYTSENGSLQMMRMFLFAISALVIGAFFTVWTVQRSADIAVLKALGASTASLLADAIGQALILLVAGTAIGTAIAAGVGALIAGTVPFQLTAGTVLFPAAVMIVLGLVGAALSVRRITSVDPLVALGSAR